MRQGLLSALLVAGLAVAAPVLANGVTEDQGMDQPEAGDGQAEPMAEHAMADGLEGTAWRIVLLDDAELLPDDDVSIAFADGRVTGRSACNRYMGGFDAGSLQPTAPDADAAETDTPITSLAFGAIAGTRMACQGRADTLEQQFLAALERVDGYQLDNDGMLRLFAGDAVLIAAEQTDPAAP